MSALRKRRPARSYRLTDAFIREVKRTTEKLVLITFAAHADDDGCNARPALSTVAQMVGLGVDQVRRIVRRHVRRGLMDPTANVGGGLAPTVYRIDLAKAKELLPLVVIVQRHGKPLAPMQGVSDRLPLSTHARGIG